MLKNHGSGNRPIHVSNQVFEQQEFLGAQIDGFSQTCHPAPDQIQLKISRAQHVDAIGGSKICDCLAEADGKREAHGQLRGKERLAHAIVGAGLEQLQSLLEVKVTGKDKQRRIGVFLTQHFHQQHDVSEDERIGIDEHPLVGCKSG